MDNALPPRDHNRPPDPIEELRTHLADTHGDLVGRSVKVLGMEDSLPAEMDDFWEGKITEAIKVCTTFIRNAEAARLDANIPHRAAISATDAFFKGMSDKVDALKTKLTKDYLSPYQRKKADEERARREAAAAEARRVEEERARRDREERDRLERIRLQEEAARREAEESDRRAREAQERALRQQEEAARQAEFARTKKQLAEAERARLAAEAETRAANESARRAREAEQRLIEERQYQEAEAKRAAEAQEKAAAEKAAAETAAEVKAKDLHHTRTDLGARSGLRTTWKWRPIEGEEHLIPRQYLEVSRPAITAAIRAATTTAGRCELVIPGVEIYPETSSVVR